MWECTDDPGCVIDTKLYPNNDKGITYNTLLINDLLITLFRGLTATEIKYSYVIKLNVSFSFN
jgi:hypothetical protein